MAFRVELTRKAEQDLDRILGWLLEEQAGEPGFRWFQGLERALYSLADFPLRCQLAPESADFPFQIRQLIYGRRPYAYRILFMIEAETVVILHIRHGKRLRLAEKPLL